MPKIKSKEKWRVYFNEPYKYYLLNIKQYYPILSKAIADKNLNDYKYYFLKLILRLSNNIKTGFKTQLKVSTILKEISLSINRPQEAYKVLAECISYIADNYNGILTEIRLLNGKDGVKVINDLNVFKNDYKQFKADYLDNLGIDDIRDALISFNPITGKELKELPEPEAKDYQEGGFIPT